MKTDRFSCSYAMTLVCDCEGKVSAPWGKMQSQSDVEIVIRGSVEDNIRGSFGNVVSIPRISIRNWFDNTVPGADAEKMETMRAVQYYATVTIHVSGQITKE